MRKEYFIGQHTNIVLIPESLKKKKKKKKEERKKERKKEERVQLIYYILKIIFK